MSRSIATGGDACWQFGQGAFSIALTQSLLSPCSSRMRSAAQGCETNMGMLRPSSWVEAKPLHNGAAMLVLCASLHVTCTETGT